MSELAARILARCEPEGDCLVWQGARTKKGYGNIRLGGRNGRNAYTHRLIYEELVGPIPEGMTIDHVAERGCTSKACCNVEHLEVVTYAENNRRAAVLTVEAAAEIRASSESKAALALRYGVHRTTIGRVLTGRTWADRAAA